MAIENNLPIIFDTATQTEDGLMSKEDKKKLDNINETLDNKLNTDQEIDIAQIPIASIEEKHLSDSLRKIMVVGDPDAEVSAIIGDETVTTDKLANGAVTIEKLDKRLLLGNVVSPRPINFAFSNDNITITIPKGSLLMMDTITERELVKGSNDSEVTLNLNYPSPFAGLNYIVSSAKGEISIYNNDSPTAIPNTSSVMALVYITANDSTVDSVSIVMHGSYTINGLSQGIGTESSALISSGKIVFYEDDGIIDFTNASTLYLIIGGVFDRIVENQTSIRIADYSKNDNVVRLLYWNNTTQALETSVANVSNHASDISKIALIKDNKIIPFVDTGIYYSKPNVDSPYYNENLEYINNISISTNGIININTETERKIEFPENTFVTINQTSLKVTNSDGYCYYGTDTGLYYIIFNLDTKEIRCQYNSKIDITEKDIIIGTIWVEDENIFVTGNFDYTIDGKKAYEDDLYQIETDIETLQDTITANLSENKILSADEIYMIEGEELPIYTSSMLVDTVEGIKQMITYNKNNDEMNPKVTSFNDSIDITDDMGNNISLIAYDKYNDHSYLKKDIKINKASFDNKQEIKILCIGDGLINDTASIIKNKFINHNIKVEMLGTQVNNKVYGEGRDGWFYSTFVGASGRGLKEEGIIINPFLRTANADDTANNPTDCYEATGQYIENSYYKSNNKTGEFFIFDFANYMETKQIETPDVVIIAIKPELASIYAKDSIVSTNMKYMQQMITGIRKALPDTYIGIVPQYGACPVYNKMWDTTSGMITETIAYVNKLQDEKIKVIPAWLHMNRELGTVYNQDIENTQLYEEKVTYQLDDQLSEIAKIQLANSIVSFILNI